MSNTNLDWEPKYEYKENKYFILYLEEKKELQSKYPANLFDHNYRKYTEEDRNLYNQYLKELCDLIFTPESSYQKFTWDIIPENEKREMEMRCKPRPGNGEYS